MPGEQEEKLIEFLRRSVGVRESVAEQLERVRMLLASRENEEDAATRFRLAVMAVYFVCAAAESILENYLDKQRKLDAGRIAEDWFADSVPYLDLLFSVRARDYHRDAVGYVDGLQILGPIELRTNPGKRKTVVFRPTLPTSEQVATSPKGGTAKTAHRGHEHVQLKGDKIMVDGESRQFLCLASVIESAATHLAGLIDVPTAE